MSKFDIVIPCHPKDSDNLRQTIKSLKNLSNKGDIYVISPEPINLNIADEYHHVSDSVFDDMFTIDEIKERWAKENTQFSYRASWIYQQLLKLFCYKKIEHLTESFMFLDSDTMILRDIDFDTDKFQYSIPQENHMSYKKTYNKMTGLEAENFSFICHHMMFKKEYLDELVSHVENLHGDSFFNVMLNSMEYDNQSPFAEQEMYGNWVYAKHNEICEYRELKTKDVGFIPSDFQLIAMASDFDMVSSHAWLRGIEAR
jgi:hypothetical protein|tara:strand:+ start:112 stop:882 length:771 start_codon:yes stop_codon:yes gene_type:complete